MLGMSQCSVPHMSSTLWYRGTSCSSWRKEEIAGTHHCTYVPLTHHSSPSTLHLTSHCTSSPLTSHTTHLTHCAGPNSCPPLAQRLAVQPFGRTCRTSPQSTSLGPKVLPQTPNCELGPTRRAHQTAVKLKWQFR